MAGPGLDEPVQPRRLSTGTASGRAIPKPEPAYETTGGLIPPGQCIGIAEKLGLITQIDRWVIRQTIQTLRQHPEIPPIAINISGRPFDEPDLPAYIAAQLAENGVPPCA